MNGWTTVENQVRPCMQCTISASGEWRLVAVLLGDS